MIYDEELQLAENVRTGNWEILCPEIRLDCQIDREHTLFTGSGVIGTKAGGLIFVKVVGNYPDSSPPLNRVEGLALDEQREVVLTAVAADGKVWKCNTQVPRARAMNSKTTNWYVDTTVNALYCTESERCLDVDKSEVRLYYDSPKLAFDHTTHTTITANDQLLSEKYSLDQHRDKLGIADVVFRQFDQRWLFVKANQAKPFPPTWQALLNQALSFCIAASITPVLSVREYNNKRHTILLPGLVSQQHSHLTRPVPTVEISAFWSCFKSFFEWAEEIHEETLEAIFDELDGIRNGSMGSLRTAALTLTSGLEALTHILCAGQYDEVTKIEGLESLKRHIKAWNENQELRQRIMGQLGAFSNPRAVDKLYAFARQNDIPDALVSAWKTLRDTVAHGKTPSSYERLLNAYDRTVELLYLLITRLTDYRGPILHLASST